MKTKKLLSLLLALLMFCTVVPFYASAAEPIALARDNITTWPTVTNLDGSLPLEQAYGGQKFNDIWALSGGEVRYDANENGELEDSEVVPGTFVFYEERILGSNNFIKISFIPDDTTAYTTIEKVQNGADMTDTGEVIKVTPIITAFPTASEVEANARLSKSTLSGGEAIHPITGEIIDYGKWTWKSSSTKVTETGYYPIRFSVSGNAFERVEDLALVRIIGDTSEVKMPTYIEEVPTIESTVTTGTKRSDYTLVGGKATNSNGVEISGIFSFEKDTVFTAIGTRKETVIFTPDDDRYATGSADISITVEPGFIKFVDENGNEIIPEITVPYGTKATSINMAQFATNCNEKLRYDLSANKDIELTVGTHTLEVVAATYKTIDVTPNFNDTTLKFKVIVEPLEFAVTSVSYYAGTEKINVKFSESNFSGTFDVYVDDILVGDDIPCAGDHIDVPYAFETSGNHTVRIVYNIIENDPCLMADYETEIQANVERHITLKDMSGSQQINVNGKNTYAEDAYILYGDTVSINYLFPDLFATWVITDKEGKTVNLEGVDLTSSEISFTMPDHDLVFAVKTTTQLEQEEAIANCDHFCHSDNELIQLFWNIINLFCRLFGIEQYCECGDTHYSAPLFG